MNNDSVMMSCPPGAHWLAAKPDNFSESLVTALVGVLTSSLRGLVVFSSSLGACCSMLLQVTEYFLLLLPSAAIQGVHQCVGSGPQTGIPLITQKMPVLEICPAL